MLLAEAIKEKDYLEKSITSAEKYILMFMLVVDKSEFKINKSLIEDRLDKLEELNKKYQQFSITIERAKAKSSIKVNDTELSLLDAEAIKKSMELKLKIYEDLVEATNKELKSGNTVCFDAEEAFKHLEDIRIDVKTLESEIEYAYWNIEV